MMFHLFYTFTMITKSVGTGEYRFVILIPGRDTEKLLDEYRASLFTKGFSGAYSFPPVAPLAELSQFFGKDELKELAGNIRKLSMAQDGKLSSAGNGLNAGFGALSFFGPLLNPSADPIVIEAVVEGLSETARKKITRSFFPSVLCAALVRSGEKPLPKEGPTLSFRAAALANLAIRPLPEGTAEAPVYSYEWEMGPLVWLPAYKKAATGNSHG